MVVRRIKFLVLAFFSAVGLLALLIVPVATAQSGMPDIGPDYHYVPISNMVVATGGNGTCPVSGNVATFTSGSGAMGSCVLNMSWPEGAVGLAFYVDEVETSSTVGWQDYGHTTTNLSHMSLTSGQVVQILLRRENFHAIPSAGFERFQTSANAASGAGVWRGTGFGAARFTAYWVMDGPPPPPPAPELDGFCIFTTTITITDTMGVTSTQQITYTRPVNRLLNSSFESQAGPGTTASWFTVVNGAAANVPGHWFQLPGLARTGSGVVYNVQSYELWQSMTVYTTGLYVAGFYATGPGAQFKWNGAPVASSGSVAEGYEVFSGTHQANAGSGLYMILNFNGADPTYVDDAFVYYTTDPDGLLPSCEEGAFEPYEEGSWGDTGNIGGVPTPIGGAGTVCYSCIPPTDISAAAISYWIAWLGCVLRNMFSCSLRVWLLVVGNWTNGVIQYFSAFANWVPLTAQQGADWFMGSVVPSIGGTTILHEGTNFMDLLIAVLGLITSLVGTLSNLLLGVVNLVTSVLELIPAALSAEPFEFEFNGGSTGGTSSPGPNDDKRLYAFLLFLGLVDQLVIGHAEVVPLLLTAMGAITLITIIWVAYFWKDVIHI